MESFLETLKVRFKPCVTGFVNVRIWKVGSGAPHSLCHLLFVGHSELTGSDGNRSSHLKEHSHG